MVRGYSPFSGPIPGLRSIDLVIHAELLKRIVLDKVPTARDVSLIGEKDLAGLTANLSSGELHKLRVSVFSHKSPVCLDPDKIILPVEVIGRKTAALLLTGLDNLMIRSTDEQWLRDTGAEIVKDFLDGRNGVLDPVTGLCNGNGFNEFLAGRPLQENHHIVLAESIPPAKSVKDALAHVSRTANLLEEFNRFTFPLFHLGNSIFCLVISDKDPTFIKWLCRSLTTLARNSGLRKIRAGFSRCRPERHTRFAAELLSQAVVEEAWQALQKAGRRGPYAFCDYELLVNPETFPLSPLSSSCVAKIAYRVKDSDTFSLIYFKPDFNDSESIDTLIEKYITDEAVIRCSDGYIVVKRGQSENGAKKWAAALIERIMNERGERYSMSAGISAFPFRDYKKSEIIKNCQKALLHGSFFGPASTVIFDALSLNVSGDAYFSESDFSGAVREYRRGLDLNTNDVNLLNSLGVTYALMNKTVKAQGVFDQVLAIDPRNFMAYFNRGLGEKKLKQYQAAVESFTHALKYYDSEDEQERGVIDELQYQLGLCLYHTKDYRRAVSVLKKYCDTAQNQPGHERCFNYIGKCYYHLKTFKQAATWLQRGLNVSQPDAESLSLLGLIYLKTGEGNDIALKLCEKSVEIEPGSHEFRLHYAQALEACGELPAAAEIYSGCARFKKTRAAALLGMARVHHSENKLPEAERCLRKIACLDDVDLAVVREAQQIKNKVKKKK